MAGAKAPKPRKKGKGLLIGVVVILLLTVAGGGVGFAAFKKIGPFAGKVKGPEPEKPKSAARRAPPKPPPSTPTTTVKTIPPPTIDPEEGATRLASLWNEVETPKLLAIAKDWKDPELARVATKMDPGKVAEILAGLPPKRASALSREMQRIASVISAND